MPSSAESIVIVGAGQAGGRAAEALRTAGFRGAVTMIGAENHPPYERPQLSKQMLADQNSAVAYLKPMDDWQRVLDVNVVTGAAVIDCDASRQHVASADGRVFPYDHLLLATGTRPRKLASLAKTTARVQYLRSIEDALALRQHLKEQAKVVIIGGGVIGLEAACAAAKQGCEVTVVESEARLLARAFPPMISSLVEARHREHGVRFVFGTSVSAGIAGGVQLGNGDVLKADLVLVGIGVEPVAELAEQIGLSARGGIEIDAFGRTAAPNVFSAGDVALQWSRCHNRNMRIETWANAQNQAACVAGNMTGREQAYQDPAWFWSDQYDLNIQVVGDPTGDDHVVRGDVASGRFSVIALRDGELAGAVAINAAKDMAVFRRLAGKPMMLERANLESIAFDLRKALKTR